MTKAQIDRLGGRLRAAEIEEADRRLLDEYRRSFAAASEQVMRILSDPPLLLAPTGREKTTTSISEKLRRGAMRLTQMQDVVGCRVVVPDLWAQELAVMNIGVLCDDTSVIDRRARPSHGYRAVHVIVEVGDRSVEVQVRTALQHWWAELSEKLSDIIDPEIKYGGGSAQVRDLLAKSSQRVAEAELLEKRMIELEAKLEERPDIADSMPDEMKADIAQARNEVEVRRLELISKLKASIARVQSGRRPRNNK